MTDRCSAPDGAPCTAQQVCEVIGDHVALCKPTFACTLKRQCEQGGMRQALADAWLASGTAASPSTTTSGAWWFARLFQLDAQPAGPRGVVGLGAESGSQAFMHGPRPPAAYGALLSLQQLPCELTVHRLCHVEAARLLQCRCTKCLLPQPVALPQIVLHLAESATCLGKPEVETICFCACFRCVLALVSNIRWRDILIV